MALVSGIAIKPGDLLPSIQLEIDKFREDKI